MTEARCPACGNYVDSEDLFCGNCGRAVDSAAKPASTLETGFVGFDCASCGASMTYDIEQGGLRCAFCGSVSLQRQALPTGRIRAEFILPFSVSREAATQRFREWIGRGFFRPFGIERHASVVETRSVYIPFWVFSGRAHVYYTGDTSHTPAFARADWAPVFGEQEDELADILVPASGSLTYKEVAALEPFDFTPQEPYSREALKDYPVEDFGVSRRGARPLARTRMIERLTRSAAARIPGNHRNVHVNPLFTDLRSAPALLPVWINAYQFRGKTYRFLINGQTGQVAGAAPFSYAKLALVIAAALALTIMILSLLARLQAN